MKKHSYIFIAIAVTVLFVACNTPKKEKMNTEANSTDSTDLVISAEGDVYMLVGTYTSPNESEGIYVYKFNTDTGKADSVSITKVENPSYLVLSADEQFVYSVGENDEATSSAHAFSFDKKHGTLHAINSRRTKGASPCYITLDTQGKTAITANYGGSISMFDINEDGSLSDVKWLMEFPGSGTDSLRQKSSHVHSVRFTPDGQYVFASDLGTDKIYTFNYNQSVFEGQTTLQYNEELTTAVSEGTGPRHFDFHPNGKQMYLLGELSGEVTVFDYENGTLKPKQVIASDTVGARGSADIHVSPDGRFLYASNRLQADGIAIFSINQEDGTLTKIGYQLTARHPRNFAITPNGKFLLVAGRDDHKIQVFSIDSKTGLLTDTHQDILISKPVCIKFASML